MIEENQNLTSVHQALQAAAQEDRKNQAPLVPVSLKAHSDTKEVCEKICKSNGTTLSSFLRKCMEGLAQDYVQ